jgi:hypothetical protein
MYDLSEVFDVGVSDAIWAGYEKGTFSSSWRTTKVVISKTLQKLNNDIEDLE